MAAEPDKPVEIIQSAGPTFRAIATDFLVWSEKNQAEQTFTGYQHYAKSFLARLGANDTVSELIPHNVTTWLNAHPDYGQSGQYRAITSVKRILNWAVDEGMIPANPLAKVRRPPQKRRERFLTEAEYVKLLRRYQINRFVTSWSFAPKPAAGQLRRD